MRRPSENTLLNIGRLLRAQRREKGLSQQDVACKAGVRRQTIADVENGRNVGSHLLQAVIDMLDLQLTVEPATAPERTAQKLHGHSASGSARQAAIDFDFPYDWSNAGNMPDTILIAKVLRGQRFMDIARLCKKYGINRIAHQIAVPAYDDIRPRLNTIMHNIRLAADACQSS